MTTAPETSLQNIVKSNARAVTDTVHQGIDQAAQALHKTTDTAVESATRLAKSADRGANSLRATEKKALTALMSYSRNHPWRVVAVSLGLGFILAKLKK